MASELSGRKAARALIREPIAREIAEHLTTGEETAARMGHLRSLGQLAAALPGGTKLEGASDRVNVALERARAQGNYSALEALERELDRDRDEEENFMFMALAS